MSGTACTWNWPGGSRPAAEELTEGAGGGSRFLRREALPPGQALRRAQLWMLDPHRRTPPDDLTGWAGFTHQRW
ncbi:hypothetical protein [Streptomyces sp. NPDC088254]|uniref:hypothetical protein n=1 Tax=Streptomyces sp. NPDC088254 TaxID=3365847 RepID=UPI00382AEE97